MKFFDELQSATESERKSLLSIPLIQRALEGQVDISIYVGFLHQAYHHVKHTTPLLMAAGSRVPVEKEWLQLALAEYIEEEIGHEQWILNDIAACGYDKEAARCSQPNMATELMVAYAYDTINRISPLGLFGMVWVLEGTSVAIANSAAAGIQQELGLPDEAFSYLFSHGTLDQEHIQFFEGLMNRIDDPADQAVIIHAARVFYRLYGDIFRSIDTADSRQHAAVNIEEQSHAA